ncbi:hypothetical protein [Flavobacterium proteolyticum]|jgi:hypothetical protein|uniref:Cytochrome c domain-containing protein n=1 Tax=Flavobacterium proteolyticum TaxID=2911683 RepID=A0ABR9WMK9_9FLAO|nr:hypothetical protein [Flavobacterium proteolyticum]MBE9575149.1 hypothetical protein [Flavobacterium proteolyticum]
MKKILLILIFVQFFISCKDEINNIAIDNKNFITGNWDFLIENGFNCYKCHKIEFGINGTGNLIISSTEKIEFVYEVFPNNKIKFNFIKQGTQTFFKQSEVFYYKNQTINDFEYFDLLDLKSREIIHSLVRTPSSKNVK